MAGKAPECGGFRRLRPTRDAANLARGGAAAGREIGPGDFSALAGAGGAPPSDSNRAAGGCPDRGRRPSGRDVADHFIPLKEQNPMDTQIRKSTKRHPWFAALLSLLMPGLGQLYCGAIIKCLWFLALTSAAGMLGVLALIPGVRLNGSLVVA